MPLKARVQGKVGGAFSETPLSVGAPAFSAISWAASANGRFSRVAWIAASRMVKRVSERSRFAL